MDSNHNGLAWCGFSGGVGDGSGGTNWQFYQGQVTVPSNGAYVTFYAEVHGWSDTDTTMTTGYFDSAFLNAGTQYYYLSDHLSNRLVTDASGNVIEQLDHYPFGESWYNATGDKLQFTTYERDSESGNDFAMARYHVNRLGRFSSVDRMSGSTSAPQSLNRYTYVGNDSVNFSDPSGLLMLPRIGGDIGTDYSGSNSCDGEMWPDGGDGFIPLSFACMNPPANPQGRDNNGGGGGKCKGPLAAGCLVQQAITRALDLLTDENCAKFIAGSSMYDPASTLAQLATGNPQYGVIQVDTIAPIQGVPINATTRNDGTFELTKLSVDGKPFATPTATITMNSNALNSNFPHGSDFGVSQTTRNALTILHELGHAINFMAAGFGSSGIMQDGPQVNGGMAISILNAIRTSLNCLH